MKIVIDIPEEHNEHIQNLPHYKRNYEQDLILEGTPLPKGHGDLMILSKDKLKENQMNLNFSCQKWIDEVGLSNATVAIIEADKAEKTAEWITKWDEEEREERHYCTNCNKYQLFQTEFCSHCGAKMKEGDTE